MRKFLQTLCLVAVGFGASAAFADTTPPAKEKEKEPTKRTKGSKAGGPCKSDEDCDQSGRPQRCRDEKCEPRPTHPLT